MTAVITVAVPTRSLSDEAVEACLALILDAKKSGHDRLTPGDIRSLMNDVCIAMEIQPTELPQPLKQLFEEAKRRMDFPFLSDHALPFGLHGLETTLSRLYSTI